MRIIFLKEFLRLLNVYRDFVSLESENYNILLSEAENL